VAGITKSLFIALVLSLISVVGCSDEDRVTKPELSCRSSEVNDLDEGPQVSYRAIPIYPYEAFANNWEGDVTVTAWIGVDSLVCDTEVTEGAEYAVFDVEAKNAALRSRFVPGTKDGKHVVSTMDLRYSFRMLAGEDTVNGQVVE